MKKVTSEELSLKNILRNEISKLLLQLYPEVSKDDHIFAVTASNMAEHGDYATNAAMQMAKMLKKNPREISTNIVNNFKNQFVSKVEIAGPGFINFFVNDLFFQSWLKELINDNEILKSNKGGGKKVMVEFVSANPTGPLHVGHGRGAAVGDSLARVYEAAGYDVYKEYYVNDGGNQMNNLAASILSRYFELFAKQYNFPTSGYLGDYIIDIAQEVKNLYGDKLLTMPEETALSITKKAGIKTMLASINTDLKRFRVKMDNYFSEDSLYQSGEIEETLRDLDKGGKLFEEDNALWLDTQSMGDDKNRVLKKSDGSFTYLTPDIAYHRNKFRRGYELLVDVWGSDHHGYIKRMQCAINTLGYNENQFDVVLIQMVNLMQNGERLVMSTRSGQFVTLKWLLDELGDGDSGVDAARFFYIMRSHESQFDFDIELAKKRDSDNPVFYVQYAHARVCSLKQQATEKGIKYELGTNLELLNSQEEKDIIKRLMEFTTIIEAAAEYNEPHRIAHYLQTVAAEFHSYYYNNKINIEDDAKLTSARLSLSDGVASVIKYGLNLLGVSAPERM